MSAVTMKGACVALALVAGVAGVGLSAEVLAHVRAGEAQVREARAAVDARQRQVLGGLLRAQRAGALAQR
jgi:hypothetical protein